MATLYVTEYAQPGLAFGSGTSTAAEPPCAQQTVAIGGGSLQSSAFSPQTTLVRLHADTAICSVEFGTNPTATAAKRRMAANQTEYFTVPANQSYKVAVITNT